MTTEALSAPSQSQFLVRRLFLKVRQKALYFVPKYNAQTLAALRIFLGLCLLYVIYYSYGPSSFMDVGNGGAKYFLNSFDVFEALSSSVFLSKAFYYTLLISLTTFTLGLFARISFGLVVAGFWLLAFLGNMGHFITPLLLGLLATLPARWGDAWSIDRLIGFAGAPLPRGRVYGYPHYILGLCIALAYFSAGLSKLILTNGDWLSHTGARWGFAQDMMIAPTDLSLLLLNNNGLAVVATWISCVGQIVYLLSCFTRNYLVKLTIGIFIAFPFLIGLVLTMGLVWWPWLLLVVILYAPWFLLERLIVTPSSTQEHKKNKKAEFQLKWASSAIILLIIAHVMTIISGKEYEPAISNYPMYASPFGKGTARSEENWASYLQNKTPAKYEIRITASDGYQRDVTSEVRWLYFLSQTGLVKGWAPSSLQSELLQGFDSLMDKQPSLPKGVCILLTRTLDFFDAPPNANILISQRKYHRDSYGNFHYELNPRALLTHPSNNCASEQASWRQSGLTTLSP